MEDMEKIVEDTEDRPEDETAEDKEIVKDWEDARDLIDQKINQIISQMATNEDIPRPCTSSMTEHVEDAVLPVQRTVRVPAHQISSREFTIAKRRKGIRRSIRRIVKHRNFLKEPPTQGI